MIKDYYSILDLGPSASDTEIKTAYRSNARKYHPDINSSFNATEMMQLVNEAYLILNDQHKRSAYDREYSIYSDWKAEREEPQPKAKPKAEPPPAEEFVDDDYSIHDEQLNDWMKEAAEAAKEIIRQVKSDTKGMAKAAGAEMGKMLIIGIVISLIGLLGLLIMTS